MTKLKKGVAGSYSTSKEAIGKRVLVPFHRDPRNPDKSVLVEMTILDAKQAYGKDHYCVTPVSGSGEIWVQNIKGLVVA